MRGTTVGATVVLLAYEGDSWLPACVESLKRAHVEPLHLVLVDNAGNTILDELDLSAFQAEVLSTPRPMGFAEANNFALVEASGLEETVVFLNQDTISPPGWIGRCLRRLQARPRLGAVSPLIRTYEDDGWAPSFLACLSEEQEAEVTSEAVSEDVLVTQHVPAPALLIPTKVLRSTGPFDPLYGSYYEDYDLCRRIRGEGYRVGFCSEAYIRHFSGGSTVTDEQERRRMRQIIRNRVIYELRKDGQPRWNVLLQRFLFDLPRRLARGLVGTASSQPPRVTLRAYRDLWSVAHRLISGAHDRAQWESYLAELGWPPVRHPPVRELEKSRAA
jgi:GT2 family glycosyltransferase